MKPNIRKELLLKRTSQSPALKAKKDKKILDLLIKKTEFKEADCVLLYLPIQGEVDISPLLSKRLNKKFVLPRVKGKTTTLTLHEVKNLEEVEPGTYKILEPKKHLPKIKPSQIDLALIPGVAFSKNGHRIGYGKGFYDRLLKKLNCLKIGIAYEFQIVNNIPGEKHDVPVDMILTEKSLRRMTRTLRPKKITRISTP